MFTNHLNNNVLFVDLTFECVHNCVLTCVHVKEVGGMYIKFLVCNQWQYGHYRCILFTVYLKSSYYEQLRCFILF